MSPTALTPHEMIANERPNGNGDTRVDIKGAPSREERVTNISMLTGRRPAKGIDQFAPHLPPLCSDICACPPARAALGDALRVRAPHHNPSGSDCGPFHDPLVVCPLTTRRPKGRPQDRSGMTWKVRRAATLTPARKLQTGRVPILFTLWFTGT